MIRITSFRQILAYLVATAMVVSGVLILTGHLLQTYFETGQLPVQLRLVFGIVLILYGVFRFVSAHFAEKRDQENRSILEDDTWKRSDTTSE